METNWLEDFLSVANLGHFARAAEQRNLTQSALSRRIKSLEQWAGSELFDRSNHPISLTETGKRFSIYAREIVENAHEAKAALRDISLRGQRNVTISCLHTLSLNFLPDLHSELLGMLPDFSTTIVAETRTIDEYLGALSDGTSDLFICYMHGSVPMDIDGNEFPSHKIGCQRVAPFECVRPDGSSLLDAGDAIPYLEYSGTSFMSRIVQRLVSRAPFRERLYTAYRSSLAESLSSACQKGLGIAWLPETVLPTIGTGMPLQLVSEDLSMDLDIHMFWSRRAQRRITTEIVDCITSTSASAIWNISASGTK